MCVPVCVGGSEVVTPSIRKGQEAVRRLQAEVRELRKELAEARQKLERFHVSVRGPTLV